MPDALLGLPWVIQLSLASGYGAYLLSYSGIRAKHSPTDTTFIVLTFGLIASGVSYLFDMKNHPLPVSLLAIMVTCSAGLIWRRFVRDYFRKTIRDADISWSDDDPSALASIAYDSKYRISQLSVELEGGPTLICERTTDFSESPFGPCRIGVDGDIALYVTHIKQTNDIIREQKTVKDTFYGDRITYVPASKIKSIAFRHVSGQVKQEFSWYLNHDPLEVAAGAPEKGAPQPVVPPDPLSVQTVP